MPNCIRLWDTLFADEQRFDFLNYCCVTVVLQTRETIMTGDFAQIMETLQAQIEQIADVNQLLQDAWELKHIYLEAAQLQDEFNYK